MRPHSGTPDIRTNLSMSPKVLLAGNTETVPELAATLQALNYSPVASAEDLKDLAGLLRKSGADTLVASMTSIGSTDLDALVNMQRESPVTTILHLEQADSATLRDLAAEGIGSLVVGVIQASRLPLLLDIADARLRQLLQMRTQIADLKSTLQERKLVDRAKGLIMGSGKYSEEQAYHALRKLAMNQNRTMADIAEGVISSPELFN
ncbi:MAG: hypothetical protein DRQ60_02260 [Gammaproteobacteria bacterium]|nr:MAG: hypothetical protein DRQ52_09135 [Gammaproteobacteria bacterium]RLA17333.1 MAG: hypothetical protein DRQ60_02260 [Gammaproteobacteria bacterium]